MNINAQRTTTKVQLTNKGIKPKEERHQRMAHGTVIMPNSSSVSDKEGLP